MARSRKLFPIYGSALANNMLAALARERIVGKFVDAYVKQYNRGGILGGAAREREIAETMGREIVLAMILEVQRALPDFFGKRTRAKLRGDELDAIDAFSAELIAALGRAWGWEEEDRKQFERDLALYMEFDTRKDSAPAKGRKRAKAPAEESPFVARVAVLLDPSILEQARRAARKFEQEMPPLARRLLKQTLNP